jgi:recombination protein RecT
MSESKSVNMQGALTPKKNAAVTKQEKQLTLKDYIQSMMPAIKAALPSTITAERFSRITLSAVSNNPKLQACTPITFLSAMMQSAQLGLEPNTPLGQAYLIPYNNHGVMEASFQLGYKGMIDLARRAGTQVEAHEVHANDKFEYSYGLHPSLTHEPVMTNRGDVIAYYAVWRNDEQFGFEVMSKEDVIAHKNKFAKAASAGSPWQTNFDAMALKTVLKKALKYAPISTDFQRQLQQDNTIKGEILPDMTEAEDKTIYDIDPSTGEVVSDDAEAV